MILGATGVEQPRGDGVRSGAEAANEQPSEGAQGGHPLGSFFVVTFMQQHNGPTASLQVSLN